MAKKGNANLHSAKKEQNNEFYTQLKDIENELRHYTEHFRGKVVYCNCDDPRVSNFFHYFSYNFEKLGLKKLISTCYKNRNIDLFSQHTAEKAVALVYEGDKDGNKIPSKEEIDLIYLEGDGDFASRECVEYLKQADIVVTNPPFSLFRDYVALLEKYNKKFLIIGNKNAITYKEIFKLIKEDKLWLGITSPDEFDTPEGIVTKQVKGLCRWFTNLDHNKRHEELILVKSYKGNEKDYPKYDNYDAIEVSKVANIPHDYEGYMGVPITFLDKYNPEHFEVVSCNDIRLNDAVPYKEHGLIKDKDGTVNGQAKYVRIVIKHKK